MSNRYVGAPLYGGVGMNGLGMRPWGPGLGYSMAPVTAPKTL